MLVAILTSNASKRYRHIATSMAEGMRKSGDKPFTVSLYGKHVPAEFCVSYGWKFNRVFKRYPGYAYFDLGYWRRESFYRFSLNGWSPQMVRGHSSERFDRLGLTIKPWQTGDEIIVAGSTAKACMEHGLAFQEWERRMVERLQGLGKRVVYRPKPNDRQATPIPGAEFDQRPISEALANCHAWVTHHSNSAIDALLAGVPVHCETGAASHFSNSLDDLGAHREGREQFLYDVAWLQWTLEEMRSGEAWKHIRSTL